ncbi:MAG: plasmid partition protein ParG [Candidatus Nanopelagicales bacterium]|jgi:hypothetical protein
MSIPKATTTLGPRKTAPAATPSVTTSFVAPDADRTKLTVEIDAELHRRFKSAVAGSGEKMRDVVEEMIEQWTTETNRANS